MKKLLFYLIFSLTVIAACEQEDELSSLEISKSTSREKDDELLTRLHQEILNLSLASDCNNSDDWKFTALGAKACGGPATYLAYSSEIDEASFLKKVQHYTALQQAYNTKWGVASDCAVVSPPNDVACIEGKPVLVYE